MKRPEIMCPAGSFETLHAAIKAGAGSVYFGAGDLNMRARSAKFQIDDLKKVADICKEHDVKSYLTLNTVMYDEDSELIKTMCDAAKSAGISAVIAMDMSVILYARSIGLEVHMSTQTNISNIEAVKFYAQYADVIVLARELNLKQVADICTQIKEQNIKGPGGELVQIEIFIHGAMCVSISGKCYMSLAQYNYSANRGACLQNCRREYLVTDKETGEQLTVENGFVMSPKDMCTIKILDKLINAGVSVLKIEGRARGPEYVYTVTNAYKQAVDAILNDSYTKELADKLHAELETVFNRGFWENGYYMGEELGEWCNCYGSKATTEKIHLGKVIHYFAKPGIAEILIEAQEMRVGDKILFTGPTTGALYTDVESIMKDDEKTGCAIQGYTVTIPVPDTVRVNDKVFLIRERS